MSSHIGVSCDVCSKTNFSDRRYKCLLCENYDLCGRCYDLHCHRPDHPMQCILTKTSYELFYTGETIPYRSIVSLTCPYCVQSGFLPRTLLTHCLEEHPMISATNPTRQLVMCPICVILSSQDHQARFVSLADHLIREHENGEILDNKRELIDHDEEEEEEGIPLYILAERLFLKEETSAIITGQRASYRRALLRQTTLRNSRGYYHHSPSTMITRPLDSPLLADERVKEQNETNDRMIEKKKRSCYQPTQSSVSTEPHLWQDDVPSTTIEPSRAENDPRSLIGKVLKTVEPSIEQEDRLTFFKSLLFSSLMLNCPR